MTVFHLPYAAVAERASALSRAAALFEPGWWWADVALGTLEFVVSGEVELPEGAVPAARALALSPQLLPGGRAPRCFGQLHAVATRRALERLDGRVTEGVVVAELQALYTGLFPRASDRREAANWLAVWLERTARRQDPDVRGEHGAVRHRRPGVTAGAADYAVYRVALARAARRTNITRARSMLAARLAHTQSVRLWGPFDASPVRLCREAALVRSLE